jgi:hypothetical protein
MRQPILVVSGELNRHRGRMGNYLMRWLRRRAKVRKCEGKVGVWNSQALRLRLRSSSHVWPPVLIQFDASSSEDASKISSEGVPSSDAQTDQIGPCGAFLIINAGAAWVVGALSKMSGIYRI